MTKPYTCIPGHSVLAPFLIVRATDEGVTLLSFSVRIYMVLFFSLNFLTYLNQIIKLWSNAALFGHYVAGV